MQPEFDPKVIEAMRRWPSVPAVHGWLRLDRRGRWLLIDRGAPGFEEALHGDGDPIRNPQIIDFIGRNYASDDDGAWYWQNGPQRVFVDLDIAPWVLRVRSDTDDGRLLTHTGRLVHTVEQVLASPTGELLVQTDLGPGVIHDLDLGALTLDDSGVLLHGRIWALESSDCPADALGFVRRPRPPAAAA
ncbi:MAG: DUF2946 family protein [Burkholderiaceae bacterium]